MSHLQLVIETNAKGKTLVFLDMQYLIKNARILYMNFSEAKLINQFLKIL